MAPDCFGRLFLLKFSPVDSCLFVSIRGFQLIPIKPVARRPEGRRKGVDATNALATLSLFRLDFPCDSFMSDDAQARDKPSLRARLPVIVVFASCLMMGLGAVAWRARTRAETDRRIARTEARACAASIELQLNNAPAAAEILGALARQPRFTNFQTVATELLATYPSLASLQLEPGGVVTDIVPRVGHERTLGINVLKDAGQRVTANEALAKRVLAVTGPVALDHGAPGIVAREPVFHRTPDGRESFWGFVAVSMRLPEALSRAHIDDLVHQGYNLAFFAPASGQQGNVTIPLDGLASLSDTVQQPVRIQNLEFRLALRPKSGWVDKTQMALESLAALVLSALVALSVNLLASLRAMKVELTGTAQQLVRESAGQTQAQADYRSAKLELETAQRELQKTRLALQKAESQIAQLETKLAAETVTRDEATRVCQTELKEARAALDKTRETIAQLQSERDAAAQAREAALAAQQRDHAKAAELKGRLEAALQAGRQTADAGAAKLAKLEQSNRELTTRLIVAERAEARVTELNALLQKAQKALSDREASTKSADEATATRNKPAPAPTPEVFRGEPSAEASKVQNSAPASPAVKAAASQPAPPVREAPEQADAPASPPLAQDRPKAPKPRKARRDDQLNLFSAVEAEAPDSDQPKSSRHLPPAPPVDPTQLRKTVSQMVPLLTERDPGAKDCLRDNRKTFRSAFAPDLYLEFEQLVNGGDSDAALEHLKKAVRKHGISV